MCLTRDTISGESRNECLTHESILLETPNEFVTHGTIYGENTNECLTNDTTVLPRLSGHVGHKFLKIRRDNRK